MAALFVHQAAGRGWGLASGPAMVAVATMLTAVWIATRRGHALRHGRRGATRVTAVMAAAVVVSAAVAGVADIVWG